VIADEVAVKPMTAMSVLPLSVVVVVLPLAS